MEEELKAIKKLGITTTHELAEIIEKSCRNIIKALNKLEIRGEIKVLIFKDKRCRKRAYMTDEIYNCITNFK